MLDDALHFALIALAVLVVWLVVRFLLQISGRFGLPDVDDTPSPPRAFGYKITWLAVRSEDAERVCRALARSDARFEGADFQRCNWESGMGRIFANVRNAEVFVTPPVDGWVLVANWRPAADSTLDSYLPVLERLSDAFGRAVALGRHPVSQKKIWALADHGQLRRCCVATDANTYLDYGEPTDAEQRILDGPTVDDADLLELADAWSLDPSSVEDRGSYGVGYLVRPD